MNDLPDDLSIRELGAADLDEMLVLVGRCDLTYREWAPADWELPDAGADLDRWRERWDRPHRWARGAYDAEGRLVAFVSSSQEFDADDQPVDDLAHLSALFVDPERWREGIATIMLAMAEAAMSNAGFKTARLWTPEGAPARAFYERQGWSFDGQRNWHPPLGLTVVGYTKRLDG